MTGDFVIYTLRTHNRTFAVSTRVDSVLYIAGLGCTRRLFFLHLIHLLYTANLIAYQVSKQLLDNRRSQSGPLGIFFIRLGGKHDGLSGLSSMG